MSTINPFEKHANKMFDSRGCDIDAALEYALELINALPNGGSAYAMTALMVLVNTASNAFAQSQGPSPEKLMVLDFINQIVGERINEAFNDLDEQVENKVSSWVASNLEDELDRWATNASSFSDACESRIESWIENNLDLSDQIESAINDMDLVVRVR